MDQSNSTQISGRQATVRAPQTEGMKVLCIRMGRHGSTKRLWPARLLRRPAPRALAWVRILSAECGYAQELVNCSTIFRFVQQVEGCEMGELSEETVGMLTAVEMPPQLTTSPPAGMDEVKQKAKQARRLRRTPTTPMRSRPWAAEARGRAGRRRASRHSFRSSFRRRCIPRRVVGVKQSHGGTERLGCDRCQSVNTPLRAALAAN